MNLKYSVLLASGLLVGSAVAYSVSSSPSTTRVNTDRSNSPTSADRRSFLSNSISGAAIASLLTTTPSSTMAASTTESDTNATPDADGFLTTESGLRYKVVTEGTGAIPSPGQTVKAHYTGWLDGFDSPKKFDSSRDRGRPFQFAVGQGQVIRVSVCLCVRVYGECMRQSFSFFVLSLLFCIFFWLVFGGAVRDGTKHSVAWRSVNDDKSSSPLDWDTVIVVPVESSPGVPHCTLMSSC